MKNTNLLKLTIVAAFSIHASYGQSMEITGVVSQTVGSTSTVTSGSSANTDTFNVGTVGVFQMNGGAAYMKVTASNPTGSLIPGQDSLMLARTSNSQGLTDAGTLSVLVRPTPMIGNPTETAWALDLSFSFFSDAAATSPINVALQLTSLDIDFGQKYYSKDSSFIGNGTSIATNIVPAPSIPGYSGFTSTPSSAFNNPNAAVASWGNGHSFDVRIGNEAATTGVEESIVPTSSALYMFEFRDASQITGLTPEPSSTLLVFASVAGLGMMRRRQRQA